ncbi:hypothetical protein PS645_04245 [Pseudomonas fluorescens]|uniref:Type I restriction modification DNA specificity domain-containing protein n=1 Tax=Pseudomonas fluorescens TaxID=294 RepID=A0A5E6VQ61_PSEFL|nr:restriction endonuclease subunit S [Pseudomonas fluorescens]VVN19900.1 hypothetical protein PS645_04245 [Pseudomonas fluorescens]
MQRYESYEPSGEEWLGNIPSHWELQPLRAVTQLKSDRNQPDLPVLSVYRDYGVILKSSREDNHNATSLDTSTYKVVKPGDLVVNKMKAWQGSMGVSSYEGIVSPAYITCTTNHERIQPSYLHYLLRSAPLIGVYNALSYGVRVGQWDMHYEDFKQIPIPLPPRLEQERIVNFLDQKTTDIDTAIAKKKQLIKLLEEQKEILINQAVTRGLNPDVEMRDSHVAWLGKVPSHWAVATIGLYARVSNGSTPSRDIPSYWRDGSIAWLSSGAVNDFEITNPSEYISELAYKQSSLRVYKAGTVVIGIVGQGKTRGTSAITRIDTCINQNMAAIESRQKLNSDFLHRYLIGYYSQIRTGGRGSNQEALNCDLVKKFPLVIPPISEQQEIVAYINNEAGNIDKSIGIAIKQIAHLEELRAIIVADATLGKIRV